MDNSCTRLEGEGLDLILLFFIYHLKVKFWTIIVMNDTLLHDTPETSLSEI